MADFINTVDILGDAVVADSIIDRSITEYNDNNITRIGNYAFYGCTELTSVNFPAATSIGYCAFQSCYALKSANLPAVTSIGSYAFHVCSALTTASFPAATSIDTAAFESCYALTSVNFPAATSIGFRAFQSCRSLTALILRSETMCRGNSHMLSGCHHFLGTTNSTYNPDGLQDGYIYVPSALVDSYKADTKWSTYATQFRALEDYTVDGTITGELDPSKI